MARTSGSLRTSARLLAAEAGSGPTAGGGALLLAVAVFTGITLDPSAFARGWDDPLNNALTIVSLLAPLVSGFAALRAQQVTASGVLAVAATSPRSTLAPLRLVGAGVSTWALAAYLGALALLLVRGELAGAANAGDAGLVGLALASLAAAVVLGLAVGRATAARLAPPAVALTVFAWIYVVSYAHSWVARLSPIYPAVYYRSFLQPRADVLLAQIGLVGAFTALLAVVVLARDRVRVPLSFVAAALGAGSLLLVSRAGTEETALRAPPLDPACSAGAVRLCLWPVDRVELQPAKQALESVIQATQGALDLAVAYVAPGLRDGRVAGRGIFVSPARPASAAGFLRSAVAAVSDEPACSPTPNNQDAFVAAGLLRSWVLARTAGAGVLPPGPDREQVAARLRQPEPLQHAWTTALLARVQACG